MAIFKQKIDLRSGKTVWSADKAPDIPCQPLPGPRSADVVIVGAGISGAMAAEELSRLGFSVIVIDSRKPLTGSTAATTALLQYQIDIPMTKLARRIGAETAVRAWRRSKLGLESLSAKIQTLGIDCKMQRRETLYMAGNVLNAAGLRQECDARAGAGLYCEYVDSGYMRDRFGIYRPSGALRTCDEITVQPLQLAAGFFMAAIENGARIFSPCRIRKTTSHARHVTLETEDGHILTARHAVFASGYEIPPFMKSSHHKVHSTWAIATAAQELPEDMPMLWEASSPYLYIRPTDDGRLICGGEDEPFVDEEKRDALLPKKALRLKEKLQKIMPHINADPEFAWTGSFGTSTTGLPSIGEIPGMPHCYGIMAFGGNGITFSRIAAEIISSRIRGRHDPEEDIFGFP